MPRENLVWLQLVKKEEVAQLKLITENFVVLFLATIFTKLILLSKSIINIIQNLPREMFLVTTFRTDIWLTGFCLVRPNLSVFHSETHLCRVALACT